MKKIFIVLGLRKKSYAELVALAELYVANMTGDTVFNAAEYTAILNEIKAAITALRTAMNAPMSDIKTESIHIARVKLEHLLTKLAARVEELANDPNTPEDNRMSIVASAGMDVKASNVPKKRSFDAVFGPVSGSVVLLAAGGASAHEWEYTADLQNFSNRKRLESTTMGRTEIFNLLRGTEYAFFHKALVRGEKTDWEGPVKFMVV